MLHGKAIMCSPIVGHLVSLILIPSQLVKEVLRIKSAKEAILVDLLNVQRASGCVRVPDLEVDGVHRPFTGVVSGNW